eukprot:scaffold3952_cov116-Isochrysis_galbana.AAC.3
MNEWESGKGEGECQDGKGLRCPAESPLGCRGVFGSCELSNSVNRKKTKRRARRAGAGRCAPRKASSEGAGRERAPAPGAPAKSNATTLHPHSTQTREERAPDLALGATQAARIY